MNAMEFEDEVRKLVGKAVQEGLGIGEIVSALEGTKFLVLTGWREASKAHRKRIEVAKAK